MGISLKVEVILGFYKQLLRFASIAIAGTVLIAAPIVAADDGSSIDWDKASPSEIHKRLWEAKSGILRDRQLTRSLPQAQKAARNLSDYDVRYYNVDIAFDHVTEQLDGAVMVVADATVDGLSQMEVLLHNEMLVDSIVAPSGALSYSRAGDVMTVTLDATYNSGEEFQFDIHYHGHPTEGGLQAFTFSSHLGYPLMTSLSEPYFSHTWWPCKDVNTDKPDSMGMVLTADTALYIASNGTLDSTVINGDGTHTFYYTVHYPIVTYLFSVAITKYVVWEDEWVYNGGVDTMPIVQAVYPDWEVYSYTHLDVTPQVLTVLSSHYGEYPFATEKYGHANFSWGGAMEHQTMTSTGGSSFGFSEAVIVHEASHQWWGDMITCGSWNHIWLNEGWASYSEALYYETLGGFNAYRSYMLGMDYSGGGTIYIYDTTNVWGIFSGIVYDKGAWVCHMLRGVLGDSLFYAGIDAYYNSEYQHASATTEQFRDVFEAASGQDLDWFFEDWIYGTYRPNYRVAWIQEPDPAGGYRLYLHVQQVQTTNPQVFRMPLDFVFSLISGGPDTLKLKVDARADRLVVHLDELAYNVQVDPLNWVMKYYQNASWTLFMVTPNEDISAGTQYIAYEDTIVAKGGSDDYTFALTGGTLPSGYSLSSGGIISGVASDTGWFDFTVTCDDNTYSYTDIAEYQLYVEPGVGVPGDADLSGSMNVADLTLVVDYLFNSGPPPAVLALADVDASCDVNVADVTYMVDYLFNSGPAPVMGCAK